MPLELVHSSVRVRWLVAGEAAAAHLHRWRGMLDAEERDRADRFAFAADRTIYMAAHALLRWMLSEATGLPAARWRFVTGPFGKPELAEPLPGTRLRFNLSHTRGLAACALALHDVGVDVERSDRTVDLSLADHYFAPEEQRLLKAAPSGERRRLFFQLWTLKEAFIKATGEGLSRPLDSFAFSLAPVRIAFADGDRRAGGEVARDWQFWEWQPAEDCVAALAARAAGTPALRLDAAAAEAEAVGAS